MHFKDKTPLDPVVLGTRIRQARERLGLPQEELANRVSKDQRAISEYENGKRRLAAVDLPTFADALEVPVLYFFEGEPALQDLDHLLLNAFARLPSQEVKRVAIEIVLTLSRLPS